MPSRFTVALRRWWRRQGRSLVVAACVGTAAFGVVFPLDLVVPFLFPQVQVRVAYAAEPGSVTTSEDELHQLVVRQNRAFRLARRLRDALPRDSFDPTAVVAESGREPQALCEWVQKHTSWLPYRGALRGPVGVLQERRGNSLDRALLVAECIAEAGHEVRIARAELPAATAEQVAAALLEAPDAPPPRMGEAYIAPELAEAIRNEVSGKSEPGWSASALAVRHEGLSEDIVGRTIEQSRTLGSLLGIDTEPGTADALDTGDADVPPAAVEAARDHFWVQVPNGDNWLDLDPQGRVWQTIRGPPAPDTVFSPEEVPEELTHRVTIRATLERWDGEKLEEAVPLERTFRAVDHFGERISFSVQPLSAARAGKDDPGAELLEIADSNDEWLPLLRVGGKSHRNASFYNDGTLNPKPSEYAPHRKLSAATRQLGAPGSGNKTRELTALWLDYRIERPGREPLEVRREIVDILGVERRAKGQPPLPVDASRKRERGLALLGETEILLVSGRLSHAALRYWLIDDLIESRGALLQFLQASRSGDREDAENAVAELRLRPVALLHLAILRHQLSPVAEHTYLDEPNILSTHLLGREVEGEVLLRMGVDLVWNRTAVRPGTPLSERSVRLQQGVLDTVAEAALAAEGRGENASSLYAAAQARGESWEVLSTEEDLRLLDESVPGDARARIAEALSAGHVVVAARSLTEDDPGPGGYAWWQVDPVTGATLGVNSNGWGGFLEDLITRIKDFITAKATKEFGLWLVCEFLAMIIGGIVASLFLGADPHSAEMISFLVGALVSGACKKVALRLGSWIDSMKAASKAKEPLALPAPPTKYLTHDEQAKTLTELLSKVADEYPEVVKVSR